MKAPPVACPLRPLSGGRVLRVRSGQVVSGGLFGLHELRRGALVGGVGGKLQRVPGWAVRCGHGEYWVQRVRPGPLRRPGGQHLHRVHLGLVPGRHIPVVLQNLFGRAVRSGHGSLVLRDLRPRLLFASVGCGMLGLRGRHLLGISGVLLVHLM